MADAVRAPEPEPVVREVRQGPVRAARRQVRERAVEDVDAHAHVERAHGVEPIARDEEGVSRPQDEAQRRRAARVRRMLQTFSASDRNASSSQHSVPLSYRGFGSRCLLDEGG